MARRICFILLALILIAGCVPGGAQDAQPNPQGESSAPSGVNPPGEGGGNTLSLAVDKTDSLNPFQLTTSLNKSLMPLLYDSLFRMDPGFVSSELLASGYRFEELDCIVNLRPDLRFSDGSAVTAADVVASFNLAKLSPVYQGGLADVLSCEERDGALVFRMARSDGLFTNLLTFPIVKNGTGTQERPVGSGRYRYSGSENAIALERNPYTSRAGSRFERVELIAMPDTASLTSSLRMGVIDYAYADLTGDAEHSLGSSTKTVPKANLVFLGINAAREPFGLSQVRKALYLLTDRQALSQRSFAGKASPAYTPFPPTAKWLPDVEFYDSASKNQVSELLDAAGLSERDGQGMRLYGEKPFSFSLLVNADSQVKVSAAEMLCQQLREAGLSATVDPQPYERYRQRVSGGDFDLYLGEIKLPDNLDLTELLALSGSAASQTAYSQALYDDYLLFRADPEQADQFIIRFLEQNPFIPLVFRDGAVAFSRSFSSAAVATEGDIFYNMDEW